MNLYRAYASGEAYCWISGDFDKPVIVIEGFDADEDTDIDELYASLNQQNLAGVLHDWGYDLVVLNFDYSKDYMQKNAMLVKRLIEKVNNEKTGDEELVIIGASMGGLITRYTLAYMEYHWYFHNVKTFISLDSPQRGANIPLGAQYWLHFFAYSGGQESALDALNIINSVAAKQMLIYQLNSFPDEHLLRTSFLSDLENKGSYPVNLRKVAFANGAGNSVGLSFEPGDRLMYWHYQGAFYDIIGHIWALPNGNNPTKIFHGEIDPIIIDKVSAEYTVTNTLPYDNSCGGTRSTSQDIVSAIPSEYSTTSFCVNPDNSFIPTISALDINTTDLFYNVEDDPNILNNTPFDQIYYSNSNEPHIYISEITKINLLNEITDFSFPSDAYDIVILPTINNVGSIKADTPVSGSFNISNTGDLPLTLTITSYAFDLDPTNPNNDPMIVYRTLDPGSYTTIEYAGVVGGSASYGPFTIPIIIRDNSNSIFKTHNVIGTLLLPDYCYGETQSMASSPEELLFDKAFIDFYVADTLQDESGKKEEKSIKERLDFAYKLLKKDKSEKVENICKEIIELYPESEMGISFYAMGLLWEATYSDSEAPDFTEKDFRKYLGKLTKKKDKYKINGYSQLILSLLDVGEDIEGLEKLFTDYEYDVLKELALFHQFIHYYVYERDEKTAKNISDKLDELFVDSKYGYQAHLIFEDDGYTIEGLKKLLKKKQESLLAKRGESKNDVLSEMPKEYKLYNNYPNPFNPTTTIKYSVPKVSNVKLRIYNMMGQLIKTLVNETKIPGFYNVEWNGTNGNNSKVASGIYFYRFESDNFVANNKMILLK